MFYTNELTLEYWEIYICNGIEAAIRNSFYKITEIYIPELKISINSEGDPLNVLLNSKSRYTSTDNFCKTPPKLLKSVKISGEQSENIKRLAAFKREEKEIGESLKSLFLSL